MLTFEGDLRSGGLLHFTEQWTSVCTELAYQARGTQCLCFWKLATLTVGSSCSPVSGQSGFWEFSGLPDQTWCPVELYLVGCKLDKLLRAFLNYWNLYYLESSCPDYQQHSNWCKKSSSSLSDRRSYGNSIYISNQQSKATFTRDNCLWNNNTGLGNE